MAEFWETHFKDKQEMWGFEPARSALLIKEFFLEQSVKDVLIPGIGYGRNAQVFIENGMAVTGIEISQTAIDMARRHFGAMIPIFHGPVSDMPFEDRKYDGIFCYGLIHLLSREARAKLIRDCHDQLAAGGWMVFTAITKAAATYRQGTPVDIDTFEMFGGVQMFFYDEASIHREFKNYGLTAITEIEENYPFYIIRCHKKVVSTG